MSNENTDTFNSSKGHPDKGGPKVVSTSCALGSLTLGTFVFAFLVLAAYGYYLIYNLTYDVHSISNDVREMTAAQVQLTKAAQKNMSIYSDNMLKQTQHMEGQNQLIEKLTQVIDSKNQ